MAKSNPDEVFWEGQATYVIVAVTYPLLLIIGTFGNVLTYHILHRTTLGDRSAASWLFKCLAVMCLSCLWMGLPRHWLRTVYDYDLRKSHYVVCKTHRFLLYCVMDITAWVIVFVSIDRLIAVFAPSRSNYLCTARNAKIAFLVLQGSAIFLGYIRTIEENVPELYPYPLTLGPYKYDILRQLCLCLFFAGFNIHIFLAYGRETVKRVIPAAPGVLPEDGSGAPSEYVKWVIVTECKEFTDNPDLVFYNNQIHPYLSFAMYVIGPFFLMLISSILISRKLAANRAMIPKEPEPQIFKQRSHVPALMQENSNTTTTNNTTLTSGGETTHLLEGGLAEGRPSGAITDGNQAQSAALVVGNGGVVQLTPTPMKTSSGALKKLANVSKGKIDQDDEVSLEKTTTRLTIAASIEFLVTATPAFFFDIIESWLKDANFFSTPRGKAQFHLIYTSVRLLLFSNFALHFFLFCFTVGRFRKEFKQVLKVWQSFIMIEQRVPPQIELEDQQHAGYNQADPTQPPIRTHHHHHDDDY